MRNYEREQAPLIIGLFSAFRCCLKYRDKNGLCFKQGFDGWLLKSNQLICIFCPRPSRRRQSLTCKSIAHSREEGEKMRNYKREQAPLIIGLFSAFRCCLKYRDKNGLCFKQGFDGWLLKSNQLICIFCPRPSRRRQSLTCKSIAHSTALKENVSFL